VALAGTAVFVALAFQVYRSRETDPARMKPERRLFKYSILYLFLLFGAVVVDRWLLA
jgi:protoheme IX farnesyltransferase